MSAVEIEGVRAQLPPAGNWAFDKAHTVVGFTARHMLTKVHGRFTAFDGEVRIAERPEDSSVKVEIQTASVSTDNEQRDGHLRSGDFFETEAYPTITFVSTAVRPLGSETFELDGMLTIKDVSKPVTLRATFDGWGPGMQEGTTLAAFSAGTTIDREDWGLTWNVAVETGGFLVSKKIDIEIEAELHLAE